jgi:hypothetical protein
MTREQLVDFIEKFYGKNVEILKAKNADYSGGNSDPFGNFKSVEILGISAEEGFLTRMMDKMMRISSFVKKGELQVKDESVKDTLADLANYSALLAAFIESKKKPFTAAEYFEPNIFERKG